MVGRVQPNILAMVAGVAVDKAQVLSGRASSITESRAEKSDDIDRLRADLSLLQKKGYESDPGCRGRGKAGQH